MSQTHPGPQFEVLVVGDVARQVLDIAASAFEVTRVATWNDAVAAGGNFDCALVPLQDHPMTLGRLPVVAIVATVAQAEQCLQNGAVDVLLEAMLDVDRLIRTVRWTAQLRRTAATTLCLQDADRLSTVGRMAAGIAHEMNNPVAWLRVNQAMLLRRVERIDLAIEELVAASRTWPTSARDEMARMLGAANMLNGLGDTLEMLDENQNGLDRIAAVSSRFSAFVRATGNEVERLDLTQVVRDAVDFARPELRHRADIQLDLPRNLRFNGRRGALTHLLVNLLGNSTRALDRMPAPPTGHVVRCSAEREGDEIVIVIEDTGPGIAPDCYEAVFEPFVSAWTDRGAVGLGLTTCRDLANEHNGTLTASKSELGGARLELRLPKKSGLMVTRAPEPKPTKAAAPSGRLRLLLVDDEPHFLAAMTRFLHRHDVQTASSAEEALQLLAGVSDFDGVLCDLMMEGMDGLAFCAAVRNWHPHLADKIVLCTGGAVTPGVQGYLSDHPSLMRLSKPVEPVELDRVLAHWAS